ncbi:MAG: hydroxymethylbilane synthase [Longimicrobiales bacterium]
MKVRLATRASTLALAQTRAVAGRIRALGEDVDVELVVVQSKGDLVTHLPLSRIGGRGLFSKEVDVAVSDGRADAAVHSLKDLPTQSSGLTIVAVLERADPRDALVPAPGMPRRLDDLPPGARVGTSSLRRRSLLLARRPDIAAEELRGNLDTRLAKLRDGVCDAAIVALAGLHRLGLEAYVGEALDPPEWLPAPGQGAIAVVGRDESSPVRALLERIDHAGTRAQTSAERAMLRRLEGGCQVPIGALAITRDETLTLLGFIGSIDGCRGVRGSIGGSAADAETLGEKLGARLDEEGGRAIIDEVRSAAAGDVPAVSLP